jgi:hypothetical protein
LFLIELKPQLNWGFFWFKISLTYLRGLEISELEGLITHSSSLVELQEKELDKIIATVVDIKASFEDAIQKSEWQKSLNILNQEIENNKKSLRLVGNNKIDICVLVRLALRYHT